MQPCDPLDELQQMARVVTARTPPAFRTADELWRLVALLEVVIRTRPDYVASFPADVRDLFSAAARAPLAAFSAPRVQ